MSKEEFERLSDFELHNKLLQCGLPNLPVTETTRNILIKKLVNHVNNERSQRKQQHQQSRRTVAVDATAKQSTPLAPPVAARDSYNNENYRRPPLAERSYVSYGGSVANSFNGNGSPLNHHTSTARSAYAQSRVLYTPLYSEPSSSSMLDRERNSLSTNNNHNNNHLVQRTIINSLLTPASQPQQRSPKMYAPPPILSSESDEESDYRNYSNISPGTSKVGALTGRRSTSSVVVGEQHNPHFSVVSRLLSLRDKTLGIQQQQQVPPVKPPTTRAFHSKYEPEHSYRHAAKMSSAHRAGGTEPEASIWQLITHFMHRPKQTFVPYVLLSTLVVFLLVLAFMYVIISPDLLSSISKETTHYQLCGAHGVGSRSLGSDEHTALRSMVPSCIEGERLEDVLKLNADLVRMLQARAQQHHCVDRSQSAVVSTNEFVRQLHLAGINIDMRKILQNLLRLEYLITLNPQWQIGVDEASTRADTSAAYPTRDVRFVLLKPKLPLSCILYNKVQRFFIIIGSAALCALIAGASYGIYSYVRGWRTARIAAVDGFVRAIETEVMQRAADGTGAERTVIINHLRDKLVPVAKRKALLWAWNEALRLVEQNDSRIQFGICMRNGEEFRSMKWIGGGNTSSTSSSGGNNNGNGNTSISSNSGSSSPNDGDRLRTKQWQSPAFDNLNKIVKPPTQCLKIRHMFDATEVNNPQLKKLIKNAIMYKVGARCNISDIQIDKQSCCVYVLCASDADAGIVHNEINGWWFDKRLVSIKFLRLERYLSRFPNRSSDANGCMEVGATTAGYGSSLQ